MSFPARMILGLPLLLGLAACGAGAPGGLTRMQDSLDKFGTGTSAAVAAEKAFLQNVQSVDCAEQFYSAAANWAAGTAASYDLTGTCTPSVLTAQQLAVRQDMLDAVALYAKKMQALASTDGDKTLDASDQALAKKLDDLADSRRGITKRDTRIAGGVEIAMVQIVNLALDKQRFEDARPAAAAMQPSLAQVIGTFQAENSALAQSVYSKQGLLELKLRAIVDAAPEKDVAGRFNLLVGARQIIANSDPFGHEALAAPDTGPGPDAGGLNSAWDAVLAANLAIANSGEGGIAASVSDLVSRAQAAQASLK